jgi:dolichol-phosphate mannosyltransferase
MPADTWILLPTYNEVENLGRMVPALLREVPHATVLVADDGSPDGTGRLADELAAADPRVRVLHREQKEGLGPAYRAAMRVALDGGAARIVQMDCDFSHDPRAVPDLLHAVEDGADLALGTRYISGGGTENWPLRRKLISRGGTLAARVVLGLPYRDLTGGFKAWRAETLERIEIDGITTSGYGFQVETSWRAHQIGAQICQVPIVFREREVGVSKMTSSVISEALLMLFRLRGQTFPAAEPLPADLAVPEAAPAQDVF